MAEFSLFPAFVRIFYHSSATQHIMTRPIRTVSGTAWEAPGMTCVPWDDTAPILVKDMVEDLIDLMLPLYPATVGFDSYIVYTQGSGIDDTPVPVEAGLFTGLVGTASGTPIHLAYQKTFSYLTEDNHNAKLILLDVPTGGNIGRSYSVSGAELTLVDEILSVEKAWAGRDDKRPVAFRSLNNSVNKALERKYRL